MNPAYMAEEWQASGLLPGPRQMHPHHPSSPGHKVTLIRDTQCLRVANSYCGSCVWNLSQLTPEKSRAQRKEGRAFPWGQGTSGRRWSVWSMVGLSAVPCLPFSALCPPFLNKPVSLTACKEDITKHQKHRGGRKKRRGMESEERGQQRARERQGRQALGAGFGSWPGTSVAVRSQYLASQP